MAKRFFLTFILLVLVIGKAFGESSTSDATLGLADENGVVWLDPREKPFRITGFKWITTDKVYRRLPIKPEWEIRKPVDSLAWHTSGGQIHFQTDSAQILVRVKLGRASDMYHMPPTGQSGFDLYLGEPGKQKYVSTSRFTADAIEYEATLLSKKSKENRHVTLNFPLYNGVKSVEVGVLAGAYIKEPKSFEKKGPIVVYGTSITQGACASRPGMTCTNILSRRLNMEFVNLGFSGNGRGEPALANLINQIENKQMVILDYEANTFDEIKKTLGDFIDTIRSNDKDVPILVMSKIKYAREINDAKLMDGLDKRAAWQKQLVIDRQQAGDTKIFFLDGRSLLGDNAEECTVDGVHPSDLGFMRMAVSIEPVLREILKSR